MKDSKMVQIPEGFTAIRSRHYIRLDKDAVPWGSAFPEALSDHKERLKALENVSSSIMDYGFRTSLDREDNPFLTVFCKAAEEGDLPTVTALLGSADRRTVDEGMIAAARAGRLEIVEELYSLATRMAINAAMNCSECQVLEFFKEQDELFKERKREEWRRKKKAQKRAASLRRTLADTSPPEAKAAGEEE
jgi:hypothetical protein